MIYDPKAHSRRTELLENCPHKNRSLVRATDFPTESLRGHFLGPKGPSSQTGFDWFPEGKALTLPRDKLPNSSTQALKGNPQMNCQALHESHWFPTSLGPQRGEGPSTGCREAQRGSG